MGAWSSKGWRRRVAALVLGLGSALAAPGLGAGSSEPEAPVAPVEAPLVQPHAPAAAAAPAVAAPAVAPAPAPSAAGAGEAPAAGPPLWSRDRRFQASWTSTPSPVPLLAFHEWTLTLRDAEGRAADGVSVEVRGGMPEHDHGLPSAPVVTPLGGGRYRIEGLRFHMPGAWVLLFSLDRDGVRDTLRVELAL